MHEVMEEAKSRGWIFGLDSIANLLEVLGNPQDSLNFVHVTGTNGKGSVCNTLASVLNAAHIKAGCYTTPAIGEPCEKYYINGLALSSVMYDKYLFQVEDAARVAEELHGTKATAFEIETALAFLYFRDAGVKIAILEVGLGGELDATNIISNTLVSVFTPISLDHTNILGDSLEAIAKAKSGIIKPNATVVSANQSDAVKAIIESTAKEKGCELIYVNPDNITVLDDIMPEDVNVKYSFGRFFEYRGLIYPCKLPGRHQLENHALVIEIIDALRKKGYNIGEEAITSGFANIYNPYRFMHISNYPNVFVDGAHNPAAIHELTEILKDKFTNQPLTFIIGVLKDKDYETMFEEILPLADTIICVQPDNPRALALYELKEVAEKYCDKVSAATQMSEAADLALSTKNTVIAFGSFYFLDSITSAIKSKLGI